ncbi:eukaryotic translation initiation factor 5B isoform X6 [Strongylocentrotus purpuratus]|uniref:PH domain-containing protein n=1 Tax=Strongylocentrotus purpuratus TaxID=7668 RepID=A0A7M7HGE6_STRPU|nr:eukaryotic translation initiation factor 5B isoform X6 [Strongylocentrotus purpuratus]
MEGLLCLSKPAKEYAEFQLSPSENNNGDTGSDDAPPKASLSGKLSSTSMTSVGSMSAVSNEDLKDFLEQMKWHINNKLDNTRIEMVELRKKVNSIDEKLKLDNTRIEMVELRKKVNSIDEKLKIVLEEKEGLCDHGNQDDENGTLETENDQGGADGDGGGGGGSAGGNGKGGIRRGSGSLAKSIKGVFMNSNNNKMDKHSNGGGGNGSKPDKQTNGGPIAEEEEVEKRKTVTFGQDVVVKEFQRVFSGKKRSKKGQKLKMREEVVEEEDEEEEADAAERSALEDEKQNDIQKENRNAKDEDIDDFTDSEEETENKEASTSAKKAANHSATALANKAAIDLAKEREASWRNSKSVDGANEYQNTTISGQPPEDFYEVPVQDEPPALPSTASRPPIKRVIDENEDFYEDPDDQESGRGSMPPGSCSDEGSGNTFVFPQKGEKTNYNEDDFNSDSTDYEDVEDVDQDHHHQEKRKKPKVDKLDEFKNDHSNEEDIDLIDRLLMLNNFFSTIKSVGGKWEKRYCIAKDGQLFIYKSYKDKQSKAQRLPLMGYTVFLLGQQGKQDNVIKIDHHNLKPPVLLASDSAETSNKWVAVLKRYSTINHTIVPGGPQEDEEPEESPDKKKGTKFFSREKKDGTPQLTMDNDVLSGYVNICGAKFGETKIRRKWILLKDMVFSCSATKDDPKNFSFSIRGIDVEAADKKEVKMKGAFKLSKDGEVYLYIEALNMLDAGHLLKQLVSASMNATPKTNTGGRRASSGTDESGVVARLLASYEKASDQTDNAQTKKGRRIQLQNQLNKNFKVKKDKEKEMISPTESAPGEKKETEKERKQREKKEKEEKKKEEKKKKEKKDKKKKKEKEEVAEVAPSTPTTPSTPPILKVSEKTDEMKKPSPGLQRKATAPVNKFKDSSMSHLLVKDKLMQDRKELETQKTELSTKRGDLRAKKMSSTDPVEKEKIQKEIDVIQKELSELSKKLVKLASEMEDATGNKKDTNNPPPENANSTSSDSSPLTRKPSVRAASPDRESVSKGTVSDRMKMFQQGK